MNDLYREAVVEGTKQWWSQTVGIPAGEEVEDEDTGPASSEFWIARYAARKAVEALLKKAKEIGVTEEQWEALRAHAAEVAYD